MTYEELLAYLKLVPEAVQDPAFYSIVATGLDPQQAAAQNISGQNQLLQAGAGALAGLASIGNTFANAVDPLARAAENYFGPITLGGLLPTVDQARQTRDEGASNYNALYGGSIPAAVGKNILQDAVLGPIARAGGAAIGSVAPSVAAGFNKLLGSGRVGQVAGGAAAGTGNALLGTGLFASDSEQPFVDQLLQNAIFGAGFGGLGGVAGNQGPLRAAGNDTPPPVARPVGPGYYGLEDAVLKAEGAPKAATADKWLQWVNGAQARGQLSKEERADVGLDDWLEEKAATGEKVTREDIQQFVTENAPQLKVVTPGGGLDSHRLFEIEQEADSDAQRVNMQSLITSIDNGFLDGHEELPAVQQLLDFYSYDANRLAAEADLITSRVGVAMFNGLAPNPDDVVKARQFYDAFKLAQDADGAAPPALSFEEFVKEAGKEGADAYNQAFKKTFPDLWANTYYDNKLDAMLRSAPDDDVRSGMEQLYRQNTSDKQTKAEFTKIVTDRAKFDRVFGPYAENGAVAMEKLRDFVAREQYNTDRSMDSVDEVVADTLGFGAVAALRNYTRDEALNAVANRFLKEKPRYEYYQWDKGNARDYHERILQLEDPLATSEGAIALAKKMGYSASEPSFAGGREMTILKDGVSTGQSAFGTTPDDALEDWARRDSSRSKLGLEKPYTHAHWDEENPLAHWRANVRDNLVDDGVPSYHIEEVQSDWHQQAGTAAREVGREDYTGYRPKPGSRAQKQYDKLDKELGEAEVASSQAWKAWDKQQDEADRRAAKINAGGGTDADMKAYEDAMAELRRLEVARNEARTQVEAARAAMPYVSPNTASYPDAPFKRSWEQLTFKSALKEAVDRGLTRISWTPGQLQSTATGQEKNTRGNDERYNKRLVNIANDLGKKYGTKVQFKSTADSKFAEAGYEPVAYIQPGPIKGKIAFAIVDSPLEPGSYVVAPRQERGGPVEPIKEVVRYNGKDKYDEITQSSYKSIEAAEQAVNGMLDKLPKVPYMNLTPRMIEDVKNGKLKLY